ncbi:uncharacterized protein [Ptychodera flava]|uniref:uncharacterized protein n=1 Tax=Ptychodera flava TaxID=63121 RepID=UPI00396A669E
MMEPVPLPLDQAKEHDNSPLKRIESRIVGMGKKVDFVCEVLTNLIGVDGERCNLKPETIFHHSPIPMACPLGKLIDQNTMYSAELESSRAEIAMLQAELERENNECKKLEKLLLETRNQQLQKKERTSFIGIHDPGFEIEDGPMKLKEGSDIPAISCESPSGSCKESCEDWQDLQKMTEEKLKQENDEKPSHDEMNDNNGKLTTIKKQPSYDCTKLAIGCQKSRQVSPSMQKKFHTGQKSETVNRSPASSNAESCEERDASLEQITSGNTICDEVQTFSGRTDEKIRSQIDTSFNSSQSEAAYSENLSDIDDTGKAITEASSRSQSRLSHQQSNSSSLDDEPCKNREQPNSCVYQNIMQNMEDQSQCAIDIAQSDFSQDETSEGFAKGMTIPTESAKSGHQPPETCMDDTTDQQIIIQPNSTVAQILMQSKEVSARVQDSTHQCDDKDGDHGEENSETASRQSSLGSSTLSSLPESDYEETQQEDIKKHNITTSQPHFKRDQTLSDQTSVQKESPAWTMETVQSKPPVKHSTMGGREKRNFKTSNQNCKTASKIKQPVDNKTVRVKPQNKVSDQKTPRGSSIPIAAAWKAGRRMPTRHMESSGAIGLPKQSQNVGEWKASLASQPKGNCHGQRKSKSVRVSPHQTLNARHGRAACTPSEVDSSADPDQWREHDRGNIGQQLESASPTKSQTMKETTVIRKASIPGSNSRSSDKHRQPGLLDRNLGNYSDHGDKVKYDKDIANRDLQLIADKIGKEWKRLLRVLNIDESDVEEIEESYKTLKERAFQGLLHWKRKLGSDATLNGLKAALDRVARRDLRESLEVIELT